MASSMTLSSPSTRLGIAMPLANEESTIVTFLEQVLTQLGREDAVYCVLDRVCKDRTRELVEQIHQRDARVNCVWAPENRCVVDAYFRGYREAMAGGSQWVLEMDGGGSHEPAGISQFIAAMEAGYDLAAGSRFCPGGRYSGRFSRYALSKGGTLLANRVLGTRMYDMTSGYECFSRRAMQAILDHGVRSRAHFFQTEIRYMLHDWRWIEIPIHYRNPSKSVGSSSIREALKNLWQLRREPKLPGVGATGI